MIPKASITAWRTRAPWTDDNLVEQDLIEALPGDPWKGLGER